MAKQFQIDTDANLTTNLQGYWPMDGNSNDFWSSDNGTDTSMSYVSGKVSSAADFSGSNAHIFMGTDFAWTKVSIAFWVKFDTLDTNDRMMVQKTNTTISSGADHEFGVEINGSGTLFDIVVNNSIVTGANVSGNFTTGTWYHIVATIDEDGDTAELFKNGSSLASSVVATQTHNNLTNGISLGERRDGFGDLDGQIDELGIWTKKLSANNIADLYNGGSGQTMVDVTATTRSPGGGAAYGGVMMY